MEANGMKNHGKFKEFMATLGEIHDKTISPLLMELYWKILSPYTDEQCDKAFKELIYSAKFFPKPPEFIDLLQGRTQDVAALRWVEVVKALKKIGAYESVTFTDAAINSTIEAMGGWIRLGDMLEDDEKWKGKEFERLYSIFSQRGGSHPGYLIGINDLSNQARGYGKEIKPIVIGFQEREPLKIAQ